MSKQHEKIVTALKTAQMLDANIRDAFVGSEGAEIMILEDLTKAASHIALTLDRLNSLAYGGIE